MNKKQKIGLVLGGGGGKGAYQIGVLKALKEYKIDKYISHISANSIGSLNTLMFISGGVEKCENIWLNVTMDLALSKKSIRNIILKKSLFSRDGFIKLAKENVDFKKVSESKIQTFVVATPIGKKNKQAKDTFKLNGLSEDEILNIILASSALPFVFESITIDGIKYMDGFFVDNVPIKPLKKNKCEIIFVVPLKDISPAKEYADKNTLIIDFVSPYNDYGIKDGTLDFKADRAKMRIEHGYNIAKQLIEKLIKDGVIAITVKQKIRKKWLDFKNRKNNIKNNYFSLSKEEIKDIPLDR